MEILLGTQALEPRGYLVTVSEQLERLGHEVRAFAVEPLASPQELRVVAAERGLPPAPHLIYSHDAEAALLLADLYPLTPQVFAAHGDRYDVWLPPQLAGIVARVAVFDDRTAERVRAASLPHELVRLRRPIDLDRFPPRGPLPERPRRARLAFEGLSDYRRGVAQRACADAGLEVDDDAEVVLGRGDWVLEAMASGRAAYVYGEEGADGWVTPERYGLLEADGFAGGTDPAASGFARLRADLDAYRPAMGAANRDLAQAHDARRHAQDLIALFESVRPRPQPLDAPLRELARLVRIEAATARRAETVAAEARAARARIEELEDELARAREEFAARTAELQQALREAANMREEQGGQRSRGVRALLGREGKVPSSEG